MNEAPRPQRPMGDLGAKGLCWSLCLETLLQRLQITHCGVAPVVALLPVSARTGSQRPLLALTLTGPMLGLHRP